MRFEGRVGDCDDEGIAEFRRAIDFAGAGPVTFTGSLLGRGDLGAVGPGFNLGAPTLQRVEPRCHVPDSTV